MIVGNRHTVFCDEIVAATELKRNLKQWLDRAREIGGLTITQGSLADLVLVRRDDIRAAYEALYFGDILVRFQLERIRGLDSRSLFFPWVKYLTDGDRVEFESELLDAYTQCQFTKDWSSFAMLLDEWMATAEALQNAQLMEAWVTRGRPEEYVSADEV